MPYYKTKFGRKPTGSLEDTTEIVLFWLYRPLLWPWPWAQWTKFSARHSGLWCCITIPGLITKCSVVQKTSSGQTFTNILNLHCDLDLECKNPFFQRTLRLMMPYYRTKFGYKWTSSLEDIVKIHRTLWLMMLYYQTKSVCKWTSSLEDIVKIVIVWIYKHFLWPWHSRQWTNFSTWHIA